MSQILPTDQRSHSIGTDDPQTYLALGQSHRQRGELAAAIDAYQKAFFYGAASVEVLVILGDLCSEAGQWLTASIYYRNAVAEGDRTLACKLGQALVRADKLPEAVAVYQQAVADQPNWADARLQLASALAMSDRLDEAIAHLTTLLQQDKSNRLAYRNLATIFTAQGNAAGLSFCQQRLAELDVDWAVPNLPQMTTSQQPETDSPMQQSRRLPVSASEKSGINLDGHYRQLDENPHEAQHYCQLADAFAAQGKWAQAIAFYKIARKLEPNNFYAALQLRKSTNAHRQQPVPLPTSESVSRIVPGAVPGVVPGAVPGAVSSAVSSVTSEVASGVVSSSNVLATNDYSFITQQVQQFIRQVASGDRAYEHSVSIIIPTYNRKDKLAKLLAALTHQTYPQQLIEVVVADDGSSDDIEAVIQKYQQHLRLVHVRQEDLGFRLAAVCNLGMRAAAHERLIFLQCDMIPRPELVEAYMQYLHVTEDVFLIGGRQFVCADNVTDEQILSSIDAALSLPAIKTNNEMWQGEKSWRDWRIALYEKTNDLQKSPYPYQAVVGSNLAFSKRLVKDIGYFSEDFQAWGGEDREYGYRAFNAGYYFIPVRAAQALHQEPPGGVNETDRQHGQKLAEALCEEKCALPLDRRYQPGRTYQVPKVSCYLSVQSGSDLSEIRQTVDSVLQQTYADLEVCLIASEPGTIQRLRETYSAADRSAVDRVRCIAWPHADRDTSVDETSLDDLVRLCQGAYVAGLRAGDRLKPRTLEMQVNELERDPASGIYRQQREKLAPENAEFRLFSKREWMKAIRRSIA